MKTNTERLRLRFIMVATDYIQAFEQKHKIDFDRWIADDIGGIAEFGDYYFNYDDIRFDIDNNIRKSTILKWYNADLEHNVGRQEQQHINYSNWCKGLRHKDLGKKKRLTKSEKEELIKIQERINKLKDDIKCMGFCNKCDRITKHENEMCTECHN